MRVLIMIPNLTDPHKGTVGGSERNVINIANYLASKGVSTGIFTVAGNEYFARTDPAVGHFCCIAGIDRKARFGRDVMWLFHLRRICRALEDTIRTFRPDILLSFGFATDVVCYLLKRRLRDGILWASGERNYPAARSLFRQRLIRQMYHQADLLLFQSEQVRRYYGRTEGTAVLPNVVDLAGLPSPGTETCGECLEFVSAGRLTAQKNYEMLLKAFAKAQKRSSGKIHLTIYGEGPERRPLGQLAKKLGIAASVSFPGYVTDLHERILGAAGYIVSSDYEGLSNAMLEAVLLGLPVITTDHPPHLAGTIIGEKSGIVVPVSDADAMADAIVRLAGDPGLRAEIRRNNAAKRQEAEADEPAGQKWFRAFLDALERKENAGGR